MQRKFLPKIKSQKRKQLRAVITQPQIDDAVKAYLERGGTVHKITRAELSRRSLASILSGHDYNPGVFDHAILDGTKGF
jgi:hypothetical protein